MLTPVNRVIPFSHCNAPRLQFVLQRDGGMNPLRSLSSLIAPILVGIIP